MERGRGFFQVSVHIAAKSKGVGVTLTHGPSLVEILTQPPADNGGTGACFSPTDLLAASLAACVLTTLALVCRRDQLPWGDAQADIEKIMTPPPRRVGQLVLKLRMPHGLPQEKRARYEEIAHTCPVALSLSTDLHVKMTFEYPDEGTS